MTDTGFTFSQIVPIDSTIPKVKCKFTANHLVFDRPDDLAVIVAKIDLVATSTVYDDTHAAVYGFPIEQTAANVNTVVTFPLQATTDSLGNGRYLKQINGSPVEYKLTVTARETGSETDIVLVNGLTFHVDAEDVDDTFIIQMAAAQDRPFLPSLTAAAKQQVDTYIAELVGLGAIVYDDGPITARVTQAEADIANLTSFVTLDKAFSGGTFGSGTDATAHVQAKIDELVAAGGGALAIPADSTFRITAPIEILSSNVTVFGFGDSSVLLMDEDDTGGPNTSAFYPAGGGIGMISSFDVTDWNGSSSYTNLTFHNFRIIGPNTSGIVDNWQSAGIDFGPVADDCSITNVAFENLRGFSAHVRGSGTRFTFSNNRLVNGGNGININTDESSFVGNVCTKIEGFELSGAGLTVTGNVLRDCGRGTLATISVGGNIGGGAYYPGSVVANNTLRDCSAGITLADAADDGKIVGNTIIGTVGVGIQVGGSAITAGNEPNGASIENNTLRNIGTPATAGGAAIGIWCVNVENPRITGNTVLRPDGNNADTDHGIYVQDCTNPTVTENHAGAANNAYFLRDSTGILYRGNELEYGIVQEQGTVTYRTRGSYLASGTTKRSFNSSNVTLEQLANVVATVIDDTDDIRAEPITDIGTQLTALSATSWYSWQDISTGSEQTLPNRVNGGAADATRGATTGAEASDPVFATGSPISFDGVDDRMILAAADAPSYTDVSGQHTVMIYGTIPTTSAATRGLYASTAGNGNGLSMFLSGGSDLIVQTGNTVTVSATRAGNINDGIPRLMAAVIDNGQIKAYVSGQGLSAGTTITDDPSSVFIAPKIGIQGNTGGPLEFTLTDIAVIDNVALTESQLDDLAAAFELAYPPVLSSGVTAARPIGTPVGYVFYDTTLGKPIWHDGAEVWVDATGTTV